MTKAIYFPFRRRGCCYYSRHASKAAKVLAQRAQRRAQQLAAAMKSSPVVQQQPQQQLQMQQSPLGGESPIHKRKKMKRESNCSSPSDVGMMATGGPPAKQPKLEDVYRNGVIGIAPSAIKLERTLSVTPPAMNGSGVVQAPSPNGRPLSAAQSEGAQSAASIVRPSKWCGMHVKIAQDISKFRQAQQANGGGAGPSTSGAAPRSSNATPTPGGSAATAAPVAQQPTAAPQASAAAPQPVSAAASLAGAAQVAAAAAAQQQQQQQRVPPHCLPSTSNGTSSAAPTSQQQQQQTHPALAGYPAAQQQQMMQLAAMKMAGQLPKTSNGGMQNGQPAPGASRPPSVIAQHPQQQQQRPPGLPPGLAGLPLVQPTLGGQQQQHTPQPPSLLSASPVPQQQQQQQQQMPQGGMPGQPQIEALLRAHMEMELRQRQAAAQQQEQGFNEAQLRQLMQANPAAAGDFIRRLQQQQQHQQQQAQQFLNPAMLGGLHSQFKMPLSAGVNNGKPAGPDGQA
uniref:Uncharacterized protein n=1 Tax=Pristionchus pacificus TaxID=54126 RepID=A0A2A6CD17_PRIPA|eukprot:PDM76019.1 hypothetical protein PRIPAC_39623 [Pristionchus pacificus]